jgi:hypothetical protein
MFYTIYKTTNNITKEFYIGQHKTKNPNDNYYGSIRLWMQDNWRSDETRLLGHTL